MSDDLMRLSDLVPKYTRYYKVSSQEAAYALYELIDGLYFEHGVNRSRPGSINDIFWVGSAGGSKRATRPYVLYFQLLSQYFYDFSVTPAEYEKTFLNCYCDDVQKSIDVPASVVYFSRFALFEWFVDAGFEGPEFLLGGNETARIGKAKSGTEFNEQELGTIRRVMNGFVEPIKAVDKAHREPPTDYDSKQRADNIKRHAYMFNHPPRANFDVYSALIALAGEAEVDMPTDHQTLRKYMRAQSKSNGGT